MIARGALVLADAVAFLLTGGTEEVALLGAVLCPFAEVEPVGPVLPVAPLEGRGQLDPLWPLGPALEASIIVFSGECVDACYNDREKFVNIFFYKSILLVRLCKTNFREICIIFCRVILIYLL